MSTITRVFISEAYPDLANYPNSITFNHIGQSVVLSINQVEGDACYFMVKLAERTFITLLTRANDIMMNLGLSANFTENKVTLEFLITNSSLAIDFGTSPVNLLFFRVGNVSSPVVLNLALELLSEDKQLAIHFKTDLKAEACKKQIDDIKTSAASKAESSEVLKISKDVEDLNKSYENRNQNLKDIMSQLKANQDSFNNLLETKLQAVKLEFHKKLDEMQMKFEEVDSKLTLQQGEIDELKNSTLKVGKQITDQEPNIPTFGEVKLLDERISLLEVKVFELKPTESSN